MATGSRVAEGFETLSGGMAQVSHYFDWIFDELAPFLGQRVLEIGPGYGNLADRILQSGRRYFAVDSDKSVIQSLKRRLALPDNALCIGNITEAPVSETLRDLKPDTLLSMNVLEHVQEELPHLQALVRIAPGSRLILFVPALPILYGSLDQEAGHFRRYTRPHLLVLLQSLKAKNIEIRYFNALGTLSWWMAARVLRLRLNAEGTSQSIIGYDRWIMPIARCLEPLAGGRFGQSLIAVAELPSA